MKKTQLVSTLALTLLAAATLGAPASAGHKHKVCKALAVIDPDNDGALDLAEAKKAASKLFDRLNRDKDNTLDKRELKGRLSERELMAGDPDKDKTLDKGEYLAIVEARFKAANTDKDDTIECKELDSRAGRALLRLLR